MDGGHQFFYTRKSNSCVGLVGSGFLFFVNFCKSQFLERAYFQDFPDLVKTAFFMVTKWQLVSKSSVLLLN